MLYRILPALAALSAAAISVPDSSPIRFEDVTEASGIDFVHSTGGWGRRHLPETMGAGGAWLDFDVDGAQDLYLVDSGELPGTPEERLRAGLTARGNRLFRNDGAGRFRSVEAGVSGRGYGRGASVADFDNDGYPDLFVGNWGRDRLYRNNGDGTFTEVAANAGIGDPRIGVSSSWADLDGDGWLDLYVATYVSYEIGVAPRCHDPAHDDFDFCDPKMFDGQRDILYRNRGDGTFEDRSDALEGVIEVDGMGLALGIADLDEDGDPDIYVANDTTPNFAHINEGGFRFVERGVLAGLGVGHDGRPQAGMGVAIADIDGDLLPDIAVTNFENEPYNLYRPLEPGFYVEDSFVAGLAQSTREYLGYGVVAADFDLDGDLDLSVANGHTQQLSPVYAQPNQLFTNQLAELRVEAMAGGASLAVGDPSLPGARGWRPDRQLLIETTGTAGAALQTPRPSRGMGEGDADGDGLLDLLITNVGDRATLLRNVTEHPGNVLVLRLRGRSGNRDAIGARVVVVPCRGPSDCEIDGGSGVVGFHQVREHQGASSYVIQRVLDQHFGLGDAQGARVSIRWRDGRRTDLGYLEANRLVLVDEGRGDADPTVVSVPLRGREPRAVAAPAPGRR